MPASSSTLLIEVQASWGESARKKVYLGDYLLQRKLREKYILIVKGYHKVVNKLFSITIGLEN